MASAVEQIKNAFDKLVKLSSGTIDQNNLKQIIQGTVEFIGKLVEQSINDRDRIDAHEKQLNDNTMACSNANVEAEKIKAAALS